MRLETQLSRRALLVPEDQAQEVFVRSGGQPRILQLQHWRQGGCVQVKPCQCPTGAQHQQRCRAGQTAECASTGAGTSVTDGSDTSKMTTAAAE